MEQCPLLTVTCLKAPPSYFRALVKTTVLAGMFSPVEKVSVANNTCKPALTMHQASVMLANIWLGDRSTQAQQCLQTQGDSEKLGRASTTMDQAAATTSLSWPVESNTHIQQGFQAHRIFLEELFDTAQSSLQSADEPKCLPRKSVWCSLCCMDMLACQKLLC